MALPRVPTAAGLLAVVVALAGPDLTLAQQAVVAGDDGGLRAPTSEEQQALIAGAGDSLSQSDAGLVAEKRADGTTILDLQGRFESVSLARVRDGKVEVGCVHGEAEARAFAAPAAAPQAEDR